MLAFPVEAEGFADGRGITGRVIATKGIATVVWSGRRGAGGDGAGGGVGEDGFDSRTKSGDFKKLHREVRRWHVIGSLETSKRDIKELTRWWLSSS